MLTNCETEIKNVGHWLVKAEWRFYRTSYEQQTIKLRRRSKPETLNRPTTKQKQTQELNKGNGMKKKPSATDATHCEQEAQRSLSAVPFLAKFIPYYTNDDILSHDMRFAN